MTFHELSKKRQSIRSFTSTPVSRDVIMQLLEAAQEAPSGGNCQPWHFYVIQNPQLLTAIYERSYHADWFTSATAAIVVCADQKRSESKYGSRGRDLYCIQDTAAAIQSILLCAAELGLGACWCGAFDETAMGELLQLDSSLRPVALIPIGYPEQRSPKPKRRDMGEIVTFL